MKRPISIDKARFGFINYFVFGELRRIPVEFFDTPLGVMAWLDSETIESRLAVAVTEDMNPVIVGDFKAVLNAYPEQANLLLQNTKMWQQLTENEAGLLMLFAIIETMRLTGQPVASALNIAVESCMDIRESEKVAVGEIAGMFAEPDFFSAPDRPITVTPHAAAALDRLFHLA